MLNDFIKTEKYTSCGPEKLRVPDVKGDEDYKLSNYEVDLILQKFQNSAADCKPICTHCFKDKFKVIRSLIKHPIIRPNKSNANRFYPFIAIECKNCGKTNYFSLDAFGLKVADGLPE